ncbi:zinc ribbon domain-containing protein [Aromatoleum toluclasticum]|uniref:FmdB family zinc ribbon protein n=1 Tax=Aromatoleum toluclasticum TaxID=92003 RepID=UPI001D18B627|nr:zinc ribbon domain-containing protein [Aromatoleum toluclasticum]MCC4115140.1 zinc ribbon domain-containing protein [Aromatoleum toluclasticum]
MPIFDYRCPACDRTFEMLVRAGDTPPCPHCGRTSLEKLVSAPAAPPQSRELVKQARAQARREGHFSNY